jgi:hypothetical protein
MVLDDWSVQQLRVSLFSSENVLPSEAGWKSLTGRDEAENRVAVPGGKQYSGKIFQGVFALTFALNRIDAILAWDPSTVTPERVAELPVVGDWPTTAKTFSSAVEPFLQTLTTPVVRIAFGAQLLAPARSREAGYEKLAKLLRSVTVDPKNMRELVYRVNWPQASTVLRDLQLNRITAWTSVSVSTSLINPGTGEAFAVENSQDAVSLEIDHNTTADRKIPLETDVLVPIFRELVTLADDNTRGGERP